MRGEDVALRWVSKKSPHNGRYCRSGGGGRVGTADGVGERLVTVLLTLAVPEVADPEDAAALVADIAATTALEVRHAVGAAAAVAGRGGYRWHAAVAGPDRGRRGGLPAQRSTRPARRPCRPGRLTPQAGAAGARGTR